MNEKEAEVTQKLEREAKYQEFLKRNENYEYPFDLPTEDQLRSIDWGLPEERWGVVLDFLWCMKRVTIGMRRGDSNTFYLPTPPFLSSVFVFIEYHPILFRYWEEFSEALIEFKHVINYFEDKEFHLGISSLSLPTEILDMLGNALMQTHFTVLRFPGNLCEGTEFIKTLTNCIHSNTRLEGLYLSSNPLQDSSNINLLFEAINNHGSLTSLSLDGCRMQRGVLRGLKSNILENIDFSSNHLSSFRPDDMSVFLSSNPSLSCLNLSNNPLNNQDLALITEAVRQNTSLHVLVLDEIDRTLQWNIIKSAIFDTTSMNAMFNSNHVCHISSFLQGDSWNNDLLSCDPMLTRKTKIYYLLSTRNQGCENVKCFDSEGIGIIHLPHILALVDTYHAQIMKGAKPLSIVYEIMRHWRMPELYNPGKY